MTGLKLQWRPSLLRLIDFPAGNGRPAFYVPVANGLQPCGFGQIDPEFVTAALIATGHFCRSVAKVPLRNVFVDFGTVASPARNEWLE